MPRRVQAAEIPACPRGHADTVVVRAGTYGQAAKVRQLWWCRPSDGTAAHRFAERLPRTRLAASDAHSCAECETRLADHEGPQHARQYEFAARVIAQALVAVGQGVTYVHASRVARVTAGVGKTWATAKRKRPRRQGANGTLVADWVGSLTPVVTGPVFDGEEWPSVVALDELPFGTTLPHSRKRATHWVIWGAYAHPESARTGQLFRLGASGDLTAKAAAAWLRSIPGRPTDVVCDGSKMWPKAVALAWPRAIDPDTGEITAETPTIWPCRYHLHQNLRERLREESVLPPRDAPVRYRAPASAGPRKRTGVSARLRTVAQDPDWYAANRVALRSYDDPEHHPLVVAAGRALRSPADWDACLELAQKWQARSLTTWMVKNAWVRDDLERRPRGVPKSIGGLEGQLVEIRRLVSDRSRLLRNTVRTQRLLDLMTMDRRGLGQVDAYAKRLRAHLEANQGTAPVQRIGITGGAHLY